MAGKIIGLRDAQRTVGAPGTAIYGGYVVSVERNPKLAGRSRYTYYSDMLANIAIVAASVRLYQNLVTQADWNLDAADESAEAVRVRDECESALFGTRTPWRQIVRRSCMYRFWGFSIQEWVMERRDDGIIALADVMPRPQRSIYRWRRDAQGDVEAVVQYAPQTYRQIYLPRAKLVYVVDDSLNDSPEGLGLFRQVYESCQELSYFEQLEGRGYERDMRGTPIGKAPLGELRQQLAQGQIDQTTYEAHLKPLKDFVQAEVKNKNTGLVLESEPYRDFGEDQSTSSSAKYDIDLLRGNTPAFVDINRAIERKQREIARVLGTEHLLLGDGAGNRALSQDKSNNFTVIVDSALNDLVAVYQRDLIAPLAAYNGWDRELLPTLRTESVKIRDPRKLTQSLRDLAGAGIQFSRDDDSVNETMDLLGLARLRDG